MENSHWINKKNNAIYVLQKLSNELWVLVHPQTKSQWAAPRSTPHAAFNGQELNFEKA